MKNKRRKKMSKEKEVKEVKEEVKENENILRPNSGNSKIEEK